MVFFKYIGAILATIVAIIYDSIRLILLGLLQIVENILEQAFARNIYVFNKFMSKEERAKRAEELAND